MDIGHEQRHVRPSEQYTDHGSNSQSRIPIILHFGPSFIWNLYVRVSRMRMKRGGFHTENTISDGDEKCRDEFNVQLFPATITIDSN